MIIHARTWQVPMRSGVDRAFEPVSVTTPALFK